MVFKFSLWLRVKYYQEHFQFLGVFTYRKHSVYDSSVFSKVDLRGFFFYVFIHTRLLIHHDSTRCTLTGLRAGLGYAHKYDVFGSLFLLFFFFFWTLKLSDTESVTKVLIFARLISSWACAGPLAS